MIITHPAESAHVALSPAPCTFHQIPIARREQSKHPFGTSLKRLRALRHTMSRPAPRLDCARLALLRPGDSLEQLQAALGEAWSPPRAKDDGWWRPARHLDGFMARIGRDARLVSVCFYGHFSMRCRVENLRRCKRILQSARRTLLLGSRDAPSSTPRYRLHPLG